jgi:hypothetical protein
MSQEFKQAILWYSVICIVIFFVFIYIIRAVFKIPTIVRCHKAQVKLLEEIAKNQGVDPATIQSITTGLNQDSWGNTR